MDVGRKEKGWKDGEALVCSRSILVVTRVLSAPGVDIIPGCSRPLILAIWLFAMCVMIPCMYL